jgi:hypothetical protein
VLNNLGNVAILQETLPACSLLADGLGKRRGGRRPSPGDTLSAVAGWRRHGRAERALRRDAVSVATIEALGTKLERRCGRSTTSCSRLTRDALGESGRWLRG